MKKNSLIMFKYRTINQIDIIDMTYAARKNFKLAKPTALS